MTIDFKKIIGTLKKNNVSFVIIGGHAVIQHGYIRATEDIDIVFRRDHESEKSLFSALKELDACWISNEKDPMTRLEKLIPVDIPFIKNNHLMMLHTEFGYLDIFDYLPGFPEENLDLIFRESAIFNDARYISLKDLIRIKKDSGRPKDINDIMELA